MAPETYLTGCGLSRLQTVAPMAFLAAWAHTFQELPIRLKTSETIEHLILLKARSIVNFYLGGLLSKNSCQKNVAVADPDGGLWGLKPPLF